MKIEDATLAMLGCAEKVTLTKENISYTSDQGKTYDFNTADKLNTLLINALVSTGELEEIEEYDVDFDHSATCHGQ